MIRLQEFCCFAFIWVDRRADDDELRHPVRRAAVAVVPGAGRICTGVFIVAINALRTLGAHRWTHDGSREMTFVEQMLDSVNYPHNPLIGGLWAPIGLRFHALHHIFPTMPYHALADGPQAADAGLAGGLAVSADRGAVADRGDRRRCGGGRRRARRRPHGSVTAASR